MLKPIVTEKSMADAKTGKYTFHVSPSETKYTIKKLVEEMFDVHVKKVYTINMKEISKRTISGRKKTIKPVKKALVVLAEGEKIDIFETKK